MDALSQFWCEVVRLKALLNEAAEYDQAMIGSLQRNGTPHPSSEHPDDDQERLEWILETNYHLDTPPPGMVGRLWIDEKFDGERMPRLDELG